MAVTNRGRPVRSALARMSSNASVRDSASRVCADVVSSCSIPTAPPGRSQRAAAAATVRDHTPAGRVGMVQGLRMVALVLVPMVVGPFIGAAVIVGANETYVDLGVERQVPTPWMFLFAAAIALLVAVPVTWLRRLPEERP